MRYICNTAGDGAPDKFDHDGAATEVMAPPREHLPPRKEQERSQSESDDTTRKNEESA